MQRVSICTIVLISALFAATSSATVTLEKPDDRPTLREAPDKSCTGLIAPFYYSYATVTWGKVYYNGFAGRSCDDNGDGIVGPAATRNWELRIIEIDSLSLDWISFDHPDSATFVKFPVEPAGPDGYAQSPYYQIHQDTRKLVVGHTYRFHVRCVGECAGGACTQVSGDFGVTATPIPMHNLTAVSTDSTSSSIELTWSRTADADTFALDRLAIVRGEGVPITWENIGDGVVVADDLPETTEYFHDTTGAPDMDYYYTVFGYGQGRGLILQSNAAHAVMSQAFYNQVLLFDDFEDGDWTACPTWTDLSSSQNGLFITDESGDNELWMVPRPGTTSAETPLALGEANWSISYSTRAVGPFQFGPQLLDDSGKPAFLLVQYTNRVLLQAYEYDEAGTHTTTTAIFNFVKAFGDLDGRFELCRSGDLFEYFIDGDKVAGGTYANADQWHDNLPVMRLYGGFEGSAYVYMDDVLVRAETAAPAVTNALQLRSPYLNGEALSTASPEIVVRPGDSIAGTLDLLIDRAADDTEIMPLVMVPSWGDPATSYAHAVCDMPDSATVQLAIDLVAPQSHGTHHLIVATAHDTPGHLASCTRALGEPQPIWNDGNDMANWSQGLLDAAMSAGLVEAPFGAAPGGTMTVGARAIAIVVDALSGTDDPVPAAVTNKLSGGVPNPFNPSTTISFSLASESRATVSIYRVDGTRVITLLDQVRSPGHHEIVWNGRDEGGRQQPSGTYFCRLSTGAGFKETRAVTLIK